VIVTIKSSPEGGTRILTDDGRDISNQVSSVSWSHEAQDIARAELQLAFIEVDAVAEARMIGPGGKDVRRIEYADGTVDEYPAT
jgi:hypothetical protein